MLSLADVMHFFTDKFARLCGASFSLTTIAPGPFHGSFLWHND